MTTFTKTLELAAASKTATQIDIDKALADVRIIDVDGTFTVRSNVALTGRGVTARGAAGTYEVTKAAMKRIEKEFNVVCDF